MALTDTAVRAAKPRNKDYKIADSGGLYLLVTPSGGRLWRFKFRLHGIEKKLAFGRYPDVSLSEARKARDAAREAASAGNDPAAAKRRNRIAAKVAVGTTFCDVAREYIDKAEREGRAPTTIAKLRWIRRLLLPSIGNRPIDQIEAHELLPVLRLDLIARQCPLPADLRKSRKVGSTSECARSGHRHVCRAARAAPMLGRVTPGASWLIAFPVLVGQLDEALPPAMRPPTSRQRV